MPTTLDINYISTKLNGSLANNIYTFQKDTANDPERLQAFFTALGQDSIIISNASLITTNSSISLTGMVQYALGYSNTTVQLSFTQIATEDGSNVVNTVLHVTPPASRPLSFRGFWLPLTNTVLALSLTGTQNIASQEIEAEIASIDNLRVRLVRSALGEWQLNLIQPGNQPIDLGSLLPNLFVFDENVPELEAFFPSQITEAITNVTQGLESARGVLSTIRIDVLNSIFNPTTGSVSFFEAGVSTTASWTLFNRLTIGNLALRLAVSNPLNRNSRQIIGRVEGDINVPGVIESRIVMSKASDLWSLFLLPIGNEGGITIPSIPHIFELAGADIGNLPAAIRTLPDLRLEEFRISFMPSNRAIQEFATRITTVSDWVLIPNYLTLNNIEVDVELERNPKWNFVAGGISATWTLGNTIEVSMGARAVAGVWSFNGSLVRSVNFTDLLNNALHLPDSFPTITLESANINATPSTRTFHLDGMIDIETSHKTALGISLPATQIGGSLDVRREGDRTVYEGMVHLELMFGGTTVILDASLGNTSGVTALNFEGQVEGDVHIGSVVKDIASAFNISNVTVPAFIDSLILRNLDISFNTETKDFMFSGEAEFEVAGQMVDIMVMVAVERPEAGMPYEISFQGELTVANLVLSVVFERMEGENIIAATFNPGDASMPPTLSLDQLVRPLGGDSLANVLPDLEVAINDIVLAIDKRPGESAKFLFRIETDISSDLSRLPVVGHAFPAGTEFSIDDLGLTITSANWDTATLTILNSVLPSGIPQFDTTPITSRIDFDASSVNLDLSAFGIDGNLPSGLADSFNNANTSADTNLPMTVPPTQPSPRPGKWFSIGKKLGPIAIKRIGILPQGKTIFFLIDGDLALAGLEMEARGLGIGFDLANNYRPSFHLDGMGIEIIEGSVEIAGAFLHDRVMYMGETFDQYSGGLVIKVPQFGISALGSYAKVKGQASVFIYAAVDATLATFFEIISLTGVALGFGYNRRLIVPPVEQIGSFPLVAEAIGGNPPNTSLLDELAKIGTYVPISLGDVFFAVGVKATVAELLDVFAMVALTVGHHFRLDIIGIATLTLPPDAPTDPLAEIQLALKVSVIPDEGLFSLEAGLTQNSFVLSRDCHLTGGFALYVWFAGANAGDFVMSLGGYHPDFKVPAHYPRVPRLGLNWKVNNNLQIKGGIYCALVPHAFMAGGEMSGIFKVPHVDAWFKVGAHFLISWKPLHYDIRAYLELGARINLGLIHIGISLGADLHIYGPEFAGTARLHLGPIHVTLRFGGENPGLKAIKWSEFKSTFLPSEAASYATINVESGLIKEVNDAWIINPKELALTTGGIVPPNRLLLDGAVDGNYSANNNIGIAPMDLAASGLQSTQSITIYQVTATTENMVTSSMFQRANVQKNVPAGLWGTRLESDLNGKRVIRNAVSGFKFTPSGNIDNDNTNSSSISINVLENNAPEYVKEFNFSNQTDSSNGFTQTNIMSLASSHNSRDTLRTALLGSNAPETNINAITTSDFLFA
ncbi:MAG TPA: hypothetical protein DCS93_19435 [Microscillaceae bacterium]|nr:hypothetical protein [Microscillaceae bacterium]